MNNFIDNGHDRLINLDNVTYIDFDDEYFKCKIHFINNEVIEESSNFYRNLPKSNKILNE